MAQKAATLEISELRQFLRQELDDLPIEMRGNLEIIENMR
jgi:hypothetical protein